MPAGLLSTARLRCKRRGFTLIELLVVIGIIAVLMSLLLPSIVGARRQARFTRCAANIEQICAAYHNYISDFKCPPVNITSPTPAYWCDDDRMGGYLSAPTALGIGSGGGVLQCGDDEGGLRSYAMNVYASGKVDANVLKNLEQKALWNRVSVSAQVMLIVEAWSSQGTAVPGYYAPPTVGVFGTTPGQRFGAGTGISPPPNENRFGTQLTELAFGRHPVAGGSHAPGTQPLAAERLNFGYADGHVVAKCVWELADLTGGSATGDSLWSPADLP